MVGSSEKPVGLHAWKEKKLEWVFSGLTWAHSLRYVVAENNEL